MRINKISLRNINSLRGDHEVDFDKSPLLEAGIFAIVGPTGSGKSTLLDAITLALYNMVPRFGKISNSEIEKTGSVITHFMKEAMAEVTYTVHDKVYRSTWSIMRNRNNNLNPATMQVVEVTNDETIISDRLSEVPSTNESIIGLNYDQFVKSILLSQGEFAQFLKAHADKRSELLEKITGTEIYRQLGKAAFEKFKEVEDEGKTIDIRLNQTMVFSEEEKQEIQKQIQVGLKTVEVLRGEYNLITQQAEKLRNFENAKSRLISLERIAEINDQNLKSFEVDSSRLKVHIKLSPYVKELARYAQLEKDIHSNTQNILNANKEINALKIEISSTEQKLSSILQRSVTAADFRPYMQKFESTFGELTQLEKTLKEEGLALRNKWLAKINASNDSTLVSISSLKDYGQVRIQVMDYQQSIFESFKGLKPKESAELLKDLQQLNHEILDLSNEIRNIELLITNTIKVKQVHKEVQELQSRKNLISESLASSTRALENSWSKLEKAQQVVEEASKSASLSQFKELLENGQPCPLCGQVVNDLENHQLADLGLLTLAAGKAKEEWQQVERQSKEVQKELSQLESHLSVKVDQLRDLDSGKSSQSLEALDADIKQAEEKKKKKQGEQSVIQSQIESIEKLRILGDSISILDDLILKGEQYTNNKQKLTDLLSGFESSDTNDVINITNNLQDILNKDVVKVRQYEAQIEAYEKDLKKIETEHIALEKFLDTELEKIGFNNIADAEANILDSITFDKLTLQKQKLDEEKVKNDAEIVTCRKDVLSLKESGLPTDDGSTLLQKRQQLENQIDELSKNIGAAQQALKTNTEQESIRKNLSEAKVLFDEKIKRWRLLKELIGDSTGKSFSTFAQQLTLEHLISLANHRLNSLTDRYLIASPDSQSDIEVIDLYQANIKRSAKTLSGGETFLISLSFALGLSDLAAKDFTLESLFIDEGFGTLDSETLESAMTTLELLQSESNKTIGIISHVDSLKERIHTQIRLVKDASGNSVLKIAG